MRWPSRAFGRDVVIAVVATIVVVWSGWAAHAQAPSRGLDAGGRLLMITATGALAWRRAAPMFALAGSVIAVGSYLLAGYPYGPVLLCVGWAMAEVSRQLPLRVSGMAAVAAGVVSMAAVLPRFGKHVDLLVFALAAWAGCWLAVPWALGALSYVRRRAIARERRDLIARTALEERIRLSREVHDVAGHGFAVIAMQAGVALVVLDEQPQQARESLDAIRATSISSLDELRRVLHTDAPQVGLQDLPALVERASDAGVHVGLRCSDVADVPAAAGANAYRVVRDSLTDVLRHAEATEVTVAVERCREGLQVTVTADGTAPGAGWAGSGSDVSPVRSVVEATGGVLTAGPAEGGGFRVAAYIPWTGSA